MACAAAFGARIAVAHAPEHPLTRRWNMDQDAVADPRIRKTAGLIEPAPHGARVALHLGRERVEIEKVIQKLFGHVHCPL